jgi:NAD(P)H dehydrogenase (quinone)
MILVTGAAGKTGKAVIKSLISRGETVHAFVHREAHIVPMRERGVTAISVGSLDDVDAITQAARGARAVYHICPNVSPHELLFARAVADGATRAGVRRFIYHSVLHPQIEAMPHHREKLRTEEMLLARGFDLTVLQPTAYMQNLIAGWQMIVAAGIYRVPYPATTRISLVDLDDVAQVAALVATTDGHSGATYELVGTPALSQSDIADILGTALGKPVRVETETLDTWTARARDSGMDEYQRLTLAKMFRYYQQHGLIGNSNVLGWLLQRAPTSLADFVRRVAFSNAAAASRPDAAAE